MSRYNPSKLKPGRFMMLTHREGYSLDDGTTVGSKTAQRLVGLFDTTDMPVQRRGGAVLRPNEDGLFPGHSQTWVVEKKGC